MVYHHTQALDDTFSALADPTRREILARLATGDHGISELAGRFDMTLPAVSKHLRVLERAGLATITRHGRVRRARLTPAPMRTALEWMERYRQFWESEFDRLAAYLESTATASESAWPNTSITRETLSPPPTRRQRSKSGARSARRGSGSSTRGRKRRS